LKYTLAITSLLWAIFAFSVEITMASWVFNDVKNGGGHQGMKTLRIKDYWGNYYNYLFPTNNHGS